MINYVISYLNKLLSFIFLIIIFSINQLYIPLSENKSKFFVLVYIFDCKFAKKKFICIVF